MYKIKLPVFEGPFDLLLYLIKKNEIDIYDIPISQITHEYLEYIKLLQLLDLEIAGEFIEMVATLILIKTRTLLPGKQSEDSDEVEDPRLQLTLQLLEYKRYKEASGEFYAMETERRQYFPRQSDAKKKYANVVLDEDAFEIDATLFDLLSAFKRALDNMPKVTVHHVSTVKVSIEDQVAHVIGKLQQHANVSFFDLLAEMKGKIYIIVTFMAILDLVRMGLVTARQSDIFGDIRLVSIGEPSMSRFLHLRESEVAALREDNEQPAP